MRQLRSLAARARGLFAGGRADAELREELESHLAMATDDNVRRGMSRDDARRAALIAAGGLTVAAEAVRERRGLPFVESTLTDLRYAIRSLRLNKAYAAAVILTLALGIGANAAMFTLINSVVLRPLPYPDPDRIVSISLKDAEADRGVVDEHTYDEWARSAQTVKIATTRWSSMIFAFGGGPELVEGRVATASYFDVLGVKPALGRTFSADEDRPGGPNVMVLSDAFWRRAFNADTTILGRTISADAKTFAVIGVMPASFVVPNNTQYWLPHRLKPSPLGVTMYRSVVARLRVGTSMDAARAELDGLTRRADGKRMGDTRRMSPVVMTLHERRYGQTRKPLVTLFAAVGVLLLIACANLANLSLARASRREREFGVRLALGAGRVRLARFVLCESLVLSVIGATAGLVLAQAAVGYFVRLSPQSVGNMTGIHVDGTVAAFTLAIAVVTAILFGVGPALVAGRGNLNAVLSGGSPRAAGGRRQRWVRRVLVVTQLATALVLLTGAGVVTRTFWRVTSLELGFNPDHLLIADVDLPTTRYTDATAAPFFDELLTRVRREPGVTAAAYAHALPVGGISFSTTHRDSASKSTSPELDAAVVGPEYLETIGARLVDGRTIRATDRDGAVKAAVINATAARLLFPGKSAIGQPLPIHDLTVVGVIRDIRQRGLEMPITPVMYVPIAQDGGRTGLQLVVRTAGKSTELPNTIRRIVQSMDRTLVSPTFTTMDSRIGDAVAPRRFTFVLLTLFAGLAGMLAVIGLYGVLAYLVAERTREIGIRVALGADASRVRRLVIGHGMTLTAVGVLLGVAGSAFAVRALRSMVFEMSVYDPRTFIAGAALLTGVAFIACLLPALRASRVDPVMALRAE